MDIWLQERDLSEQAREFLLAEWERLRIEALMTEPPTPRWGILDAVWDLTP